MFDVGDRELGDPRACSELEGLMLKSVIVLAEALKDPAPAVRLRAASEALALGLKSGDVKKLHRRLDHLDSAFALYRRKRPPLPFVNQRGSY